MTLKLCGGGYPEFDEVAHKVDTLIENVDPGDETAVTATVAEINQIFRNAFDRIVLNGEDIATVLEEEGENLQTLMNETGAPCWAPDPLGDGPCVVNP